MNHPAQKNLLEAEVTLAVISGCQKYRYFLTRDIRNAAGIKIGGTGIATFIMLNPSTADAEKDDPTIRKCKGFAERWGCHKIQVINLFAYRATAPEEMKKVDDPVGALNARFFSEALAVHHEGNDPGIVICAWGAHGSHRNQDIEVMRWLSDAAIKPQCLGTTKDGHPLHPLYVPYDARRVEFTGRKE